MLRKNIFTINPRLSFIDALAKGILDRYLSQEEQLSKMLILLPNRRSCRSLKESLLKHNGGKALILPHIRAVGDIEISELLPLAHDEVKKIKPQISPVRRKLLLTQIIKNGISCSIEQAVNLADELGGLLDEMQIHRLSTDNLQKIVPEELSEHWQKTLDVLNLLSHEWPEALAKESVMDEHDRRNRLMSMQALVWQKKPPDFPIIAAGSTGSIPATSELLKVVIGLPRGEVVLPGVDLAMDDEQWENLAESHPQFLLKKLIEESLEIDRKQVKEWECNYHYKEEAPRERGDFVREVMRPAHTVEKWTNLQLSEEAIKNVSMLQAGTIDEEAMAIALMMRGQVEARDKTAALVTNERVLAKKVSIILQRWNIAIYDSAEVSLLNSNITSFLLLIGEMVTQKIPPIALLAVLKHNLCACGYNISEYRKLVSALEVKLLRGARIAGGLKGLEESLKAMKLNDLAQFVQKIADLTKGFENLFSQTSMNFAETVSKHVELAEKLAETNIEGGRRFWKKDAQMGEELQACLREIISSSQNIVLPPSCYSKVLKGLLADVQYRPEKQNYTGLSILSPIEARLQHFDLMILAGLNKGSWPLNIQTNWLSKRMREDIGLPPEDCLLGLSAHDFASFVFSSRVVVTRSEKVDSNPTVASSWWMRMETVAKVCGLEEVIKDNKKWIEWGKTLNEPGLREEVERPAPIPSVGVRPRTLSVTQIEKLVRDPYSVYARHVLGLKKLDDLDEDPDMSDFGNIIHKILENFTRNCQELSLKELISCGKEIFADYENMPSVTVLWWPRFEKIAEWFVANEVQRRKKGLKVLAEVEGSVSWRSDAGQFKLKARADRIEVSRDNRVSIIDYKTGTMPSNKDMNSGLSPQVGLEGWIASQGGFKKVAGAIDELACWKVNIGDDMGKIVKADVSVSETGEEIKKLINFFDNEDSPYIACPDAKIKPIYSDYEHLERVKEWE